MEASDMVRKFDDLKRNMPRPPRQLASGTSGTSAPPLDNVLDYSQLSNEELLKRQRRMANIGSPDFEMKQFEKERERKLEIQKIETQNKLRQLEIQKLNNKMYAIEVEILEDKYDKIEYKISKTLDSKCENQCNNKITETNPTFEDALNTLIKLFE